MPFIQLADKVIPPGWKRIVGLTAIVVALILNQVHLINDGTNNLIIAIATLVTGVGVAADKVRKDVAIQELSDQLSAKGIETDK